MPPRHYGWIPDGPDQRDHLYAAPPEALGKLPTKVDLRPMCPAVYDQGELQSCTANAIAAAIQFDQTKQQLKQIFTPSRLFIYYNERVMEGTVDSDPGASIRDGIKSVASLGACPEAEWPYDIAQFRVKPSDPCYQDAQLNKAVLYQRVVQNLNQMKGCLYSGYPFVFGFTVYESFETPAVAKSGQAPLPGPTEQKFGGHAVVGVGYDDSTQSFIVRNSWGPAWGMAGYFTLPYAYLSQASLSSDFWTIRLVGAAQKAAETPALSGVVTG
jgi:C1A family cysteine protease